MNKLVIPQVTGWLVMLTMILWVWPAALAAGPVRITGKGIEFSDGTKQASSESGKWRNRLPAAERFKPALETEDVGLEACAAVLDQETGLVWEKTPDPELKTWEQACKHCYQKELAGRKGWRLPTIEELSSVVDTSRLSPSLPEGCPFTGVHAYFYWSATTDVDEEENAWYVVFAAGYIGKGSKESRSYAWCVRGED